MRACLQVLLIISAVSSESVATDDCSSAELRAVLHEKSSQVIKVLEEQWAKAYASRDTARLNCILADDFEISSMPDEILAVHDKHHVLEWVVTRTGSAELEHLQTRPFDSIVLARGVYAVRTGGMLVSRFQFADVFVYRSNRWQAVARTIADLPLK